MTYRGHADNDSALQKHSVGDLYPNIIYYTDAFGYEVVNHELGYHSGRHRLTKRTHRDAEAIARSWVARGHAHPAREYFQKWYNKVPGCGPLKVATVSDGDGVDVVHGANGTYVVNHKLRFCSPVVEDNDTVQWYRNEFRNDRVSRTWSTERNAWKLEYCKRFGTFLPDGAPTAKPDPKYAGPSRFRNIVDVTVGDTRVMVKLASQQQALAVYDEVCKVPGGPRAQLVWLASKAVYQLANS